MGIYGHLVIGGTVVDIIVFIMATGGAMWDITVAWTTDMAMAVPAFMVADGVVVTSSIIRLL
jgi:hypothetical protein